MGLSYDLTSIFSLYDAPLPPVECDGIRMEAYQPSISGPVFHAKGDTMIRVKDFRLRRTKYNVYQFTVLYGSPLLCVAIPTLIFQKYADWMWWIRLFLMLNLLIWVGGIMLSNFVTAWVLGCIHGVRQRPVLTMRQRARALFKVVVWLDWDIQGPDGVILSARLEPSVTEDDIPAAEDQAALDAAGVAGLAKAQERASIAEARVAELEAKLELFVSGALPTVVGAATKATSFFPTLPQQAAPSKATELAL